MKDSPPDTNGWHVWKNSVIKQLADREEGEKENRQSIHKIDIRLSIIEVKAGFWGALGGAVVIIGMWLYGLLTK